MPAAENATGSSPLLDTGMDLAREIYDKVFEVMESHMETEKPCSSGPDAAADAWMDRPWEEGGAFFDSVAKQMTTKQLLRELCSRLGETDAALTQVSEANDEGRERIEELERSAAMAKDVVQALEKQIAETSAIVKDLKEARDARIASSQYASTSRGEADAPAEDSDKVLLRGVAHDQLKAVEKGEMGWLCGGVGGVRFVRSWQSATGKQGQRGVRGHA
jgi:hypothetical protein